MIQLDNKLKIRIVWPSSQDNSSILDKTITETHKQIPDIEFLISNPLHSNTISSNSDINDRVTSLVNALTEVESHAVLCARGGYGASDILPQIPWNRLSVCPPKLIFGFSDISALHSAFFTKLGWPSVHSAMPATEYWGKFSWEDIKQSFAIMRNNRIQLNISVESKNNLNQAPQGRIFGGCFSVLTNLIGTPFFPNNFRGMILFFEDIGENIHKINRMLNQWIFNNLLDGVQAIILGSFTEKNTYLDSNTVINITPHVSQLFLEKLNHIPLFISDKFGHQSPNFPIIIGSKSKIRGNNLLINNTEY